MNWDAISAISEFAGVALIVASMIYVARQLRQTNTMMRINAASERLERDYEIVAPLIESGELAEIWLKGENEFESLRPADQQRLLFFERRGNHAVAPPVPATPPGSDAGRQLVRNTLDYSDDRQTTGLPESVGDI